MTTATDTGFIVSYVLFLSIMLFLAPFFQPDLFNVSNSDIEGITTTADANLVQVIFNFINDVIARFSVLIGISTCGSLVCTIIGIFTGAYSIGAVIVMIRIIAEALP